MIITRTYYTNCAVNTNHYDGAISLLLRRRVDFNIDGGRARVRGRRDDERRIQLGVRGLHIRQPQSPGTSHKFREVHPGKLCHTGRRQISWCI